jgi:hypothetical protein
MPASAEDDQLVWIVEIRPTFEIFPLKAGQIDQHLLGRRLAGEQRNRHRLYSPYGTAQGLACQISAAYWAIVRSLENLPDPAIFKIALRAH